MGKRRKLDPESLYTWERITFGKEEAKHRERVRARVKYKYWQKTWDEVLKANKPEELMQIIFDAINNFHGWGYRTQAWYAEEALNLFLEDIGVKKS